MYDPENKSARFSLGDAPMGWSSKSPASPGWYFNAERTYQAYWDGERWTGVTRPPPPDRPQERATFSWVWILVAVSWLALLVSLTIWLIR